MILHVENAKDPIKKVLDPINEFCRAAGYKADTLGAE